MSKISTEPGAVGLRRSRRWKRPERLYDDGDPQSHYSSGELGLFTQPTIQCLAHVLANLMLTADNDYINSSYNEEEAAFAAAAAVNVSVTMMSRRAGMLAWTPGDAFAGKKVEVVFAPKGSRHVIHSIQKCGVQYKCHDIWRLCPHLYETRILPKRLAAGLQHLLSLKQYIFRDGTARPRARWTLMNSL